MSNRVVAVMAKLMQESVRWPRWFVFLHFIVAVNFSTAAELLFEYKGVRLGATEKQFLVRHKEFGCHTDRKIPEVRVCAVRDATYADLNAESVEAQFLRNRLSQVEIRFPETRKPWEAIVNEVQLVAALSDRYGKPHGGSPEWKVVAPGTSLRDTVWYGKNSSLRVFTYWNHETLGQKTTMVISVDSHHDELSKIRKQKVDKDL